MLGLRALTYNVHWGIGMDDRLDLRRVGDVIRRLNPDVVGIQEVDRNRRPETDYEDQLAILADYLSMEFAYGVTIEKEPTERSGGEPRQYGIAVLTPHEIRETRNHHLTRLDGTEQRTLLETRIAVEGEELPFFNTHFGLQADERARQAEDVLDITRGVGDHVLVGDFNARPESRPVSTLTSRYEDVLGARGLDDAATFPTPYVDADGGRDYVDDSVEAFVPNRRIDYVFCTSGVDHRSADVVHSLASDHSPVVADLSFPTDRSPQE